MKKGTMMSDLVGSAPNRRSFLQKIGVAGAAGAAVASAQLIPRGFAITDVDILQFALNLEYLEAEFYTVATMGKTIDQVGIGITGSGVTGPTTGGKMVSLSDSPIYTKTVAEEIGADERAHVTLLRSALQSMGVTPIAKPPINLNALGIGFNNQSDFLTLARAFEDIGVTAYGGAAPLIQDKNILGTAARVLAAEAEHVGNIRLQVARLGVPTMMLDGVDILPPPSGRRFISVTSNGLTAIRTPGQVLYLAYGLKANVESGGFFPTGFNGRIQRSGASA